jgi:hypothetical protein
MLVRPFVSRVCLFFAVSLPACESEIAMCERMQMYNSIFSIKPSDFHSSIFLNSSILQTEDVSLASNPDLKDKVTVHIPPP